MENTTLSGDPERAVSSGFNEMRLMRFNFPSLCSESDEKFIVLIFENGLVMKEQAMLEDILGEIGRANGLVSFPAKLPFEEANIRLVNYNKALKQKEDKVSL